MRCGVVSCVMLCDAMRCLVRYCGSSRLISSHDTIHTTWHCTAAYTTMRDQTTSHHTTVCTIAWCETRRRAAVWCLYCLALSYAAQWYGVVSCGGVMVWWCGGVVCGGVWWCVVVCGVGMLHCLTSSAVRCGVSFFRLVSTQRRVVMCGAV